MKTLDRDGTKLAYLDSGGAGRPVALIHGWCCDHSFFEPQLEHFAKTGLRVIAFDLRGHGASAAPRFGPLAGGLVSDVLTSGDVQQRLHFWGYLHTHLGSAAM